jgi:hypothetical protein
MSAADRRAPGDSLHVDRVGDFFNLCKVIIHLQGACLAPIAS